MSAAHFLFSLYLTVECVFLLYVFGLCGLTKKKEICSSKNFIDKVKSAR